MNGNYRGVRWAILALAAVFFALHAVHLNADFPNHSPWMDWAKYTDEGWYGDAAIRYFLRGNWYVSGDFNPAVALPVWPLLEAGVFSIFGVSLGTARGLAVGVFGAILIVTYLLLRRMRQGSLVPAIAVLLLAVSPFIYAFSRLAILEPLLILLTLLGLYAGSFLSPQAKGLPRWLPTITLGIIMPLMVLTKTTAVFLLPAIFWMIFAQSGYRWRSALRFALPAGAISATLWASYFLIFVRPHYLADYRYLFSANQYTSFQKEPLWKVIANTFRDGMWMGRISYLLVAVAIAAVVLTHRKAWRNPLYISLLLWVAGYFFFLAYHNNLQPRYYLVVAVPLTILLAISLTLLSEDRAWVRGAAAAALAVVTIRAGMETLHYVRTPEYTYLNAAKRIRSTIDADPRGNHLVLSISGSNLALMTGLPAICDDFGTMDLDKRVAAYKPGWFIAWNIVEDDKMDALAPLYKLTRVAEYPALDDPERNLLIVYRLDPKDEPKPVKKPRKQPQFMATSLSDGKAKVSLDDE
ncbi:ArnT family glycosyltransferase [Terriglobus tenax]|uniref:ArnT family glycosyltransferase n=1 Tax=Terriglobus tenax TaxID=1111115 RepID=UPI0021E0C789|nr:glycosyltransferase family 39 protein [Terriglobus tenax]